MNLFVRSKLEIAQRQTRRHQVKAADPSACAWVSANAGTGKTHVLTMRVLRLLLAGTPPERILALTYTRAAAAEMSARVFQRLSEWVTAPEDRLHSLLALLLDRAPTSAEVERARRLFAIAIETPGGLKVETIHAFCERLLKRFPLEAGVPARFAILDEHQRRAVLAEAADQMLSEAMERPGTPLAEAVGTAIAYATDGNFDGLVSEALREREWLMALDAEGEAGFRGAEAAYRRTFGLSGEADSEASLDALSQLLSDGELARLREVLATGSNSDRKASVRAAEALAAGGRNARSEALARLFLTDKGEKRKSLMTRTLASDHPDMLARLIEAQARFAPLYSQLRSLRLLGACMALNRIGHAVMQRYGAAKARRAALDFDDLVGRAAQLLGSSAAVEWVLFKLDGGLDHILIDEAQDTSPLQWRVIRSLAEEFFAGRGQSEAARTLFAVGDEKQSIYGFQGAAPAMFAEVGEEFAKRAARARLAWGRVPLNLSFRATAPLLAAVDKIFAEPARTPGVSAKGSPPQHIAQRSGQAGCIEIWPPERKERSQPAEPFSPLEEQSTSSPILRLATRIADTIARWLALGEKLQSENRPVRAGDILILVRKRVPFAAAMISALKARSIPVAGADRLVLSEQIAVQDLLALGDFLVLEDDDLALAAVLKSPLFGLDDDDLLAFAPGRRGSLWQQLLACAGSNARLRRAAHDLAAWQASAKGMPPFELYARLLDGMGMRTAMLQRLGAEAADAIDEFLSLALAYGKRAPASLQGFLSFLRGDLREVTRDMEQGRDEVRVMTVHGAKGLEAPIVFLPDTCSTRSGRRPNSLLKLEGVGGPRPLPAPILWPVKGTSGLAVIERARASLERAEAEERNRLLYVALTRARDRLYVAGFESGSSIPTDCWYNQIREALGDWLQARVEADGRTIWRAECAQSARHEAASPQAPAGQELPLPAWAKEPAPREALLTIPRAPSRLAPLKEEGPSAPRTRAPEPAILSPAMLSQEYRFLRGNLTHALLEHLPGLPRERWEDWAQAFVAGRGAELPEQMRKSLVGETLKVLSEPAFAQLFGPDARAEVAIAAELKPPDGRGPALRLLGRIDRLVLEGNTVRIVDYKTNRPPPSDPDGVAEAYLLQLAAYRLAVAQIFKGFAVRAAILWTDGPRLMEIPGHLLDTHEPQLWQLDKAEP